MDLYSGPSDAFLQDSLQNQLTQKLEDAWFQHYGFKPHPAEVAAWRNSLDKMANVLRLADLTNQGISIEYRLPMTSKRLDCMVLGYDEEGNPGATIVELKQWSECAPADGEHVVTWLGGAKRATLHPSVQVNQYQRFLAEGHTAFHDRAIGLDSCAYLHNYRLRDDDALLDPKFTPFLEASPIFTEQDASELATKLEERLSWGQGHDLLPRIKEGTYRPSKKLMENVAAAVEGQERYILLDEQLEVFDTVVSLVGKAAGDPDNKHAVIVHGGPGTGKSVLAVNLLGRMADEGFAANYATGSRSFTKSLWRILGTDAKNAFRYFHNYAMSNENDLDVLICDESHRIRKTSVSRFTPKDERSGLPQVVELLRVANVSVFFIDENQGIRPREVGSAELIREHAEERDIQVHEMELKTQFRCAGSGAFVGWVENTLNINRTPHVLWEGDEDFDFRLVGSPEEMENMLRQRLNEGHSARMVAGFCWPWSKELGDDDRLVEDVKIGDWERPWNAHDRLTGRPKDAPKASHWAIEDGGFGQVGCVYTAQGFEFDYVGVIWGPDLVYDPDDGEWIGQPEESEDTVVSRAKTSFLEHVKNTYRVLLSRGMKGCYLYVMDEDTRRFVKSRLTR